MAVPTELKVGHLEDIQELRRTQPSVVPERYVRENSEQPSQSRICKSLEVPIIDMRNLDGENHDDELARLTAACLEWGFFQASVN
jgi:hypothetical protein